MMKSDELENKRIVGVRNKTKTTINGLAPGSTLLLETNEKGDLLDKDWRKTLHTPLNKDIFETITRGSKKVKAPKSNKRGGRS